MAANARKLIVDRVASFGLCWMTMTVVSVFMSEVFFSPLVPVLVGLVVDVGLVVAAGSGFGVAGCPHVVAGSGFGVKVIPHAELPCVEHLSTSSK